MKRERLQLPPEQTHRNWKRKKVETFPKLNVFIDLSIRRRKLFFEEKTYKMFNCQLPIPFFGQWNGKVFINFTLSVHVEAYDGKRGY